MTTATRSVAVVATRLPNIDRRALSQAWFSALHLAQPQPGAAQPRGAAPSAPARTAAPLSVATNDVSRSAGGPQAAQPRRPTSAAPAPGERRLPAGDLARRMERAILRRGMLPTQQTVAIAINAGDGRVQLLVRADGGTTRIVAICAPHLRERVDRALAHARFALAGSGARQEVVQ